MNKKILLILTMILLLVAALDLQLKLSEISLLPPPATAKAVGNVNLYVGDRPPQWSNQSQSSSSPEEGSSNTLKAYWTDDKGLNYTWLSTNETGNWTNQTPMIISGVGNWSSFTWQNNSLSAGTLVVWKIYANDTGGNENVTDILNFTIKEAAPPAPPGPPAAPPAAPAPPAVAPPGPSFEVDTTDPSAANITGTNLPAGDYEGDTSNSTELGISKLSFSLEESVSYVRIIIKKIDRPAYITPKEENYQYISISVEGVPPQEIKNIRVDIRVEKDWMGANRIDEDTIVLSMWTGRWEEIRAFKAREDADYVYFTATVPGVGIFSISGEKAPIIAVPFPGLPAVQINVLLMELNLLIWSYPLLLVMLAIALLLFFILMLYGRKIKDKIRRMEIIEVLKDIIFRKKKRKK